MFDVKAPLIWILLLSFTFLCRSGTTDNLDFYSVRPKIELLPAIITAVPEDLPKAFGMFKKGAVEFVCQLLAFYPNDELYFLARDGESLYDLARILLKDTPEKLNRLHLLNVSRRSMGDPLMPSYLKQEGLTLDALVDRKAILIDTGINGQIPEKIKDTLGPKVSNRVHAHMMYSSNPDIPLSRVYFNSAFEVLKIEPESASEHAKHEVEEFNHFTETAEGYRVQENGRIEAVSKIPDLKSYQEQQRKALLLMQALHYLGTMPEVNLYFNQRLSDMKLLESWASGNKVFSAIEFQAVANRFGETQLYAYLADLKEACTMGNLSISKNQLARFWKNITFEPLALRARPLLEASLYRKFAKAAKENPELIPYIEGHRTLVDIEANKKNADLVLKLLRIGDWGTVESFVKYSIYGRAGWEQYPELVTAMMDHGDRLTLRAIPLYFFRDPRWAMSPAGPVLLLRYINEVPGNDDVLESMLAKEPWSSHPRLNEMCANGLSLSCLRSKTKSVPLKLKSLLLRCREFLPK